MCYFIDFFMFPIFNLPFLLLVAVITVAVFYIGKKVYKITSDDLVNNEKDKIGKIIFIASLLSALSQGIVTLFLYILYYFFDFFYDVFSEWGYLKENIYIQTLLFYIIWNILYVMLTYLLTKHLRFKFKDKVLSKKLFILSITAVAVFVLFLLTAVTLFLDFC